MFDLRDVICSCFLIRYEFTCSLCILSRVSPFPSFHINLYALSTTLCSLSMSDLHQGWTVHSNKSVDSTVAWTTTVRVRFVQLDFHSHFLALNHAWLPLLILAFRSFVFPTKVLSILVLSKASLPKSILSSLPSWHFSSYSAIAALTTFFPAKVHHSSLLTLSHLLRNKLSVISNFWLGSARLFQRLSGEAASFRPTPLETTFSALSVCRLFSLVRLAWLQYDRWRCKGDVAHPSRSPRAGCHGSLRPSCPLLFCMLLLHVGISALLEFLLTFLVWAEFSRVEVCLPWGMPFLISRRTAPGLLCSSDSLGLPITVRVSSSTLIISWVASAVNLTLRKPFWFSSSAPISSNHVRILDAKIRAMILLASGRRQTPL